MCSQMRRFVHLLANDLKGGYTLRNIDMGPLFADANVAGTGSRFARLPRPLACFECPDRMEFFLLGSKIVGINARRTILCDTVTSAVRMGPHLLHNKSVDPAWAAVGGRLFVTNTFPDSYGTPCFEALCFDDRVQDWVWELLPSPPLLDMDFEGDESDIQSYGAGDDRNIWVSTMGKGTYAFDVTTGAWCKAGGWALPFDGRVQYIPDYNLCLGFCNETKYLCSAELSASGDEVLEPPLQRRIWDVDAVDDLCSGGWYLARSYLTYLGCGKFCVTRFFNTTHDFGKPMYHVAVMTAVDARLTSGTGELNMVTVASRRYKFKLGTWYGWAL